MQQTHSGQGHHTEETAEKTPSAPPCPHLPYNVKRALWANLLTNLQVSLITLLMRDWEKLDLWVLEANCWALGFQDGVMCVGVSERLPGDWWQDQHF